MPDMKEVSPGSRVAYAAGSVGTGVFSTIPTVLLLYFCTEIIGIAPALAALIVMLPKTWSVIWDPFVGAWSDRHRGRFGRRRPFLLLGNVGVVISFILLFSPPVGLGPDLRIAWIALAYFFLVTTYSLFAVPYIALPAELSETNTGRRRLVAWRIAFGLLGVLLGASFAPYLIAWFGGAETGYANMALLVATLCGIMMLAPFLMMRGRERERLAAPTTSLLEQLKQAATNRGFMKLCVSYFLQLTAVGILTSSLPYVVTKVLGGSDKDIGTAMGAMMGVSILSIWVWTTLARKYGEKESLIVAAILFAVASALLAMLINIGTDWEIILVSIGLAGLAFSGIQVLPFSLLAHLAHDHSKASDSSEATMTGVWAAAEKMGLAVGPALTASILSIVGVDALANVTVMIMGLLLVISIIFVSSEKYGH